MSSVKFVSITNAEVEVDGKRLTPEELIVYIARVSAPANQENLETSPKLLKHLIKNKHWSPLEQVDFTVEIVTSRAIAPQILRHKSFCFQEWSQRYSSVDNLSADDEICIPRRQDNKNRQNSIDDLSDDIKQWFVEKQKEISRRSRDAYNEAIQKGIAKECARFLLPLSTRTRIYMKGSVRSWIHYLLLRCDTATQKEHRDIALKIRELFFERFPNIKLALEEEYV